jgi:hypothetical protein
MEWLRDLLSILLALVVFGASGAQWVRRLRVIDTATQSCRAGESPLEWDVRVRSVTAIESAGNGTLTAAAFTTIADVTQVNAFYAHGRPTTDCCT